jgi:hypothetical protein
MRLRLVVPAVLLLAATAVPAQADTLTMPDQGAQTQQGVSIDLPVRGMTMKQVEAKFGSPQKKIPAVGDPPITRWVYPDYTVYFEYRYVIHAVLNRK